MLLINRKIYTDQSTIGELFLDSIFQCYTLEDTVRRQKVTHQTAIPPGRYEVVLNYSPKFKRDLPLLLDVPGFTDIRIHAGNTADDSSGCVLLGLSHGVNMIWQSQKALAIILPKIEEKLEAGKLFVDVIGGLRHAAVA